MKNSWNACGISIYNDRIVSYYAIIMQVKRFQFVILYHYRLSIFEERAQQQIIFI